MDSDGRKQPYPDMSNGNRVYPNEILSPRRVMPVTGLGMYPPASYGSYPGVADASSLWPPDSGLGRYPPPNPSQLGLNYAAQEPASQDGGAWDKNPLLGNLHKSIVRLHGAAQFCYSSAMLGQYILGSFLGVVESIRNVRSTLDEHRKVHISILKSLKSIALKIRDMALTRGALQEGEGTPEVRRQRSRKTRRYVISLVHKLVVISAPWIALALITRLAYQESLSAATKPKKEISFARVVSDFVPFLNGQLELKAGEIVAILEMSSNYGGGCVWWRGRKEDGSEGYFPSIKVELLKKKVEMDA